MDDAELVREIISVAHTILGITSKNNIMIFVGQSPHYFSHLVAKHRTTISVAFSGRAFIDQYSIPNTEQKIGYKSYLESLGLSKEFIEKNSGNIILVDHSHSGESPQLFVKTLETILDVKLTGKSKLKFINLISPEQASNNTVWIRDPPEWIITTIGYIVLPNLIAFSNEGQLPKTRLKTHTQSIPRSIPSYPFFKWEKPPSYYHNAECDRGIKNIELLEKAHNCPHISTPEVYFKPYKLKIDIKRSDRSNTAWQAIKCMY